MSLIQTAQLRAKKRLPVIVPETPQGGWVAAPLFSLIRKHLESRDATPAVKPAIRFAGLKSRPYNDVVYDTRHPQEAYRLAHHIIEHGGLRAHRHWRAMFAEPIVLILPRPDEHKRAHQEAVMRGCRAEGQKGERFITPVIKDISESAFLKLRNQGEQIALSSDFELRATGASSYRLDIRYQYSTDIAPLSYRTVLSPQ